MEIIDTTWDEVRRERRTLEDQIRKDCARAERLDVNPEDFLIALHALREMWTGELEDL